jgi:ribosomal protein L40E
MDTEYVAGSTITESQGEPDRTEHRDPRFEKSELNEEALIDKEYSVLDVVPNADIEEEEEEEEEEEDEDEDEDEDEEEEEEDKDEDEDEDEEDEATPDPDDSDATADMKKEEPVLCPKCNHPNPSYAKLCIKCGSSVENKAEVEAKDEAAFVQNIETKPVSGVVAK